VGGTPGLSTPHSDIILEHGAPRQRGSGSTLERRLLFAFRRSSGLKSADCWVVHQPAHLRHPHRGGTTTTSSQRVDHLHVSRDDGEPTEPRQPPPRTASRRARSPPRYSAYPRLWRGPTTMDSPRSRSHARHNARSARWRYARSASAWRIRRSAACGRVSPGLSADEIFPITLRTTVTGSTSGFAKKSRRRNERATT